MAKRFINAPSSVVPDLLRGISLDSNRVTIVNPRSRHHVGILSNLGKNAPGVRVISGGGAGHEPAMMGYIGTNMLSGAVSGEVFTSPSVPAVFTCLKAVEEEATGVLIIVMNYTGDRLNFGLAAEKFNGLGRLPVNVVVVADDIALHDEKRRRGIAGTVFVLKIAGAAAGRGLSLEKVTEVAQKAADSVLSIGVALSPATIPGKATDKARLQLDEMEIGMGIHGETGAFKGKLSVSETFCIQLIEDLCGRLEKAVSERPNLVSRPAIALLVNNLGAVPVMEMQIIAAGVSDYVFGPKARLFTRAERVYMLTGTFLTSLDMNGMSISVLMMDDELEGFLLADTNASAWTKPYLVRPPSERISKNLEIRPGSTTEKGSPPKEKSMQQKDYENSMELRIRSVLTALEEHVDTLARYDQQAGDGDFGLTLSRCISLVRKDLSNKNYDLSNPPSFLASLSDSLSESGGSSGVLYSIFFSAASTSFAKHHMWHKCFLDGTYAIMKHGGASVGDRTMVDSLFPAANALGADTVSALKKAVDAASDGARKTASIVSARAGRAAYVPKKNLKGVPDPGAVAVSVALESLLAALNQSSAT